MSLIREFKYQAEALNRADAQVVGDRLTALLDWMESQPEIKKVLDDLRTSGNGEKLIEEAEWHRPPKAKTNKEIAAVGLALIEKCRETQLWEVAMSLGIQAPGAGNNIEAPSQKALKSYIEPFANYVLRELPPEEPPPSGVNAQVGIPVAIQESLHRFLGDHPEARKACFIMMRFGETHAHANIERVIKATLDKHGLRGLLARDKEYHEDLYPNIQTYTHGCGFGIAIFEHIESEEFNPNVSLEVGYMLALKKPVLLLKDRTLPVLQTDLVGKMYRPFDPLEPEKTIPAQIERWLEDKGFI